jgi:hypothetical protein
MTMLSIGTTNQLVIPSNQELKVSLIFLEFKLAFKKAGG